MPRRLPTIVKALRAARLFISPFAISSGESVVNTYLTAFGGDYVVNTLFDAFGGESQVKVRLSAFGGEIAPRLSKLHFRRGAFSQSDFFEREGALSERNSAYIQPKSCEQLQKLEL